MEIPKASGGVHLLDMLTALDSVILQAMERAQSHTGADFGFVFDLKKFFDRVNHDILMTPVAQRVADKFLLGLICGFLTAEEQVKAIVIDFLARRL